MSVDNNENIIISFCLICIHVYTNVIVLSCNSQTDYTHFDEIKVYAQPMVLRTVHAHTHTPSISDDIIFVKKCVRYVLCVVYTVHRRYVK